MITRSRTRRDVLQAAAALFSQAALIPAPLPASESGQNNTQVLYGQDTLPHGIRSRLIDSHNGVTLHILEAGFEKPGRPCVLLLHGFPELAYSWRHQLLPLAGAGFHVVAPDLRGYGCSAAVPVAFDDDLVPYSVLNRVSDVLGLARALGHERVAAVVGHDWGGPTAQWCARVRPDVFRAVVSMSTPIFGSPVLPLGGAHTGRADTASNDIDRELAALPRPRKHYSRYSATREANENMWHPPQGVHDFLRALYFFKSADFEGNRPHALKSWTATELAKMPTYYIMDRDQGMAETAAMQMPSPTQIVACRWLTEGDLAVYAAQFARTGFQGGLNYYRINADARFDGELNSFSDRTIDVPALYIGGDREWAVYQSPGAFEAMHSACRRLLGVHLVAGAGHSIAEEQPEEVNQLLVGFMRRASTA
jgi:pimeloyl-ACP methyl ester carboxylesterase